MDRPLDNPPPANVKFQVPKFDVEKQPRLKGEVIEQLYENQRGWVGVFIASTALLWDGKASDARESPYMLHG